MADKLKASCLKQLVQVPLRGSIFATILRHDPATLFCRHYVAQFSHSSRLHSNLSDSIVPVVRFVQNLQSNRYHIIFEFVDLLFARWGLRPVAIISAPVVIRRFSKYASQIVIICTLMPLRAKV